MHLLPRCPHTALRGNINALPYCELSMPGPSRMWRCDAIPPITPCQPQQVEFSIWCLAELEPSTRKITRCDMVWDMLSLLENIGFPVEGIPVLGLRDRVSGAFGQVTAAAANLLQTGIAAPGQLLHQAAGLVGLGGASTSDTAMQQEPENK